LYYLHRIIFLLLLSVAIVSSQDKTAGRHPKWEVRAVWLTTVSGLDWPRSLNINEQKRSLQTIVERLAAANYNTIFFQVRGRGDAMYQSSFEPWSAQLTGTLGNDPGWDPLDFIIKEAHAHNMELHAWFNTFLVKNGNSINSQHVVSRHPEWMRNVGGETWLDPGIPAARLYTLRVALDIVRNYDIDGIHFDFMRYPEKGLSDDGSYRKYGNRKIPKGDWRRKNINAFASAFKDSALSVKPRLKIGSAPIGIYQNIAGINGLQSYNNVYQDSREWLKQGWQDYIVPQVYWALGRTGGHPDFAVVARDWAANTYGRQIFLGVGAYKADVAAQVPLLIDTTRALGLYGNSFFRYEHINKMLGVGGRYNYPAFVPPMPWKDSTSPNPPEHLHIQSLAGNYFKLNWAMPLPAKDGDSVKWFNIYRSSASRVDVNDIRNLVCTVRGDLESYVDTIIHPSAARYSYAITAMDYGNNESPSSHEEHITIPAIVKLSQQYANRFALGNAYPSSASEYVYFAYELAEPSAVWLTIMDKSNNEVLKIDNGYQQPGKYVAGANIEKLGDGEYTCSLTASRKILTRSFVVQH
jgi:uncharacterized lipoprotein YddW (UPF0748 family)